MSPAVRVRTIVADALGLDLEDVPDDATMESVADWDSLQHLSVVTALEAELAVALSPEQVSELTSIAKIVRFVESEAR